MKSVFLKLTKPPKVEEFDFMIFKDKSQDSKTEVKGRSLPLTTITNLVYSFECEYCEGGNSIAIPVEEGVKGGEK